jgi:hypothetical protein
MQVSSMVRVNLLVQGRRQRNATRNLILSHLPLSASTHLALQFRYLRHQQVPWWPNGDALRKRRIPRKPSKPPRDMSRGEMRSGKAPPP